MLVFTAHGSRVLSVIALKDWLGYDFVLDDADGTDFTPASPAHDTVDMIFIEANRLPHVRFRLPIPEAEE